MTSASTSSSTTNKIDEMQENMAMVELSLLEVWSGFGGVILLMEEV